MSDEELKETLAEVREVKRALLADSSFMGMTGETLQRYLITLTESLNLLRSSQRAPAAEAAEPVAPAAPAAQAHAQGGGGGAQPAAPAAPAAQTHAQGGGGGGLGRALRGEVVLSRVSLRPSLLPSSCLSPSFFAFWSSLRRFS